MDRKLTIGKAFLTIALFFTGIYWLWLITTALYIQFYYLFA